MKKLTTLSGLVDYAWNEKCDSDIREFFSYSDKTILSIYFRGSVLTTELKIPVMPVYELTYFIRDPSAMTTMKNFDTNVTFGTVNENVEATILKMTSNLLAPKFYRTKTWSDSILFIVRSSRFQSTVWVTRHWVILTQVKTVIFYFNPDQLFFPPFSQGYFYH